MTRPLTRASKNEYITVMLEVLNWMPAAVGEMYEGESKVKAKYL